MRVATGLLIATLALAQHPDAGAGKKIYEAQCSNCHGLSGAGGRGPSLTRPKLARAPDDDDLRKLISNGYGDMPGAWQLHPDEVVSVAAYVRTLGAIPPEIVPGDADRGAGLYAARGCASCHTIAGKGEGFGPELTAIGSRRSAAYLRQTILKPSSSLPQGFQYISATPATGAAVRGIRVNEDSFTIQLRDAAGRYHSFRKSSLKEIKRLAGETPMPALDGQISSGDADDLAAYLASLKGKS
jgi:putative heme-binding domain-containing protein